MDGAMYFPTGMTGGENLEHRKGILSKEFFRDPAKWWDNRDKKRRPGQPDFKHKVIREALWTDSHHNPSWVAEEFIRRGFAAQCHGNISGAFSPSLVWACCRNKDLVKGTRLHDELQQRGFVEKDYSDALITLYSKCGDLQKAQALLDMHNSSYIIPWTALIAGYTRQGKAQNALDCFERMQREGITPNAVTFTCILKACAVIGAVDKGKQIHEEILKQGLLKRNILLGTALVDMYAKCGALTQARSVLEKLPSRDVVAWNALIAGYAQQRQGQQALECFEQMKFEGILPGAVTYACILKACAAIGAIDKGKQIHDEISRQGLLEHNIVIGTALMDMYAKCGAFCQMKGVLENFPSHDIISWNALISGYTQSGQGHQALECYEQMQDEGILPNAVTYMYILKACGVMGATSKGKQIHDEISRQGLVEHDIMVGTALVDMYAKCGALSQAKSVLVKLPSRDIVSWDVLIAGYAQKGQCQATLECFGQMQCEGILPNVRTYLSLLNLCGHLGLVEKGQELFASMEAMYGLKPDLECFTCMIDLLGRAGHLVKAINVIKEMPFSANSPIWHCLLGACQKWVDVNVGMWAFEQAIKLDRCDEAAYVLMVNIYAAFDMQKRMR